MKIENSREYIDEKLIFKFIVEDLHAPNFNAQIMKEVFATERDVARDILFKTMVNKFRKEVKDYLEQRMNFIENEIFNYVRDYQTEMSGHLFVETFARETYYFDNDKTIENTKE